MLVISLILIFSIYKYYSKIDTYVKQFLPSQNVADIKEIMNKLDNEELKNK
jgi:predicted PurR-regulated permease PerM